MDKHNPPMHSFLDLAPEIRLEVYSYILDIYARKSYYDLCCTCHLIRKEALPLILKLVLETKRIDRMSWPQFSSWVQQGTSENLEMVRNLHLILYQDCFEALEESPRHAKDLLNCIPASSSIWDRRYGAAFAPEAGKVVGGIVSWSTSKSENTIAALSTALASLPNVHKLSLVLSRMNPRPGVPLMRHGPRPHHSVIMFRPEKELILDMIAYTFPDLIQYSIMSDRLPVLYLRHFVHLRHLECTGYFRAHREEVIAVLRSLKHLDSITINQSSLVRGINISIDRTVIPQLNPLKAFRINPCGDNKPSATPLTPQLMNAFRCHADTLQDLYIIQHFNHPDTEAEVLDILRFASGSPIQDISIELLLPSSLVSSLDPSRFNRTGTTKHVDIHLYKFGHTSGQGLLHITTGKYLPTSESLKWRRKMFPTAPGDKIPHALLSPHEGWIQRFEHRRPRSLEH